MEPESKKKRGRPPKRTKQELTEEARHLDDNQEAKIKTEAQEMDNNANEGGSTTQEEKRKRGRPPKPKVIREEESQQNEQYVNNLNNNKRKRGRPRKTNNDESVSRMVYRRKSLPMERLRRKLKMANLNRGTHRFSRFSPSPHDILPNDGTKRRRGRPTLAEAEARKRRVGRPKQDIGARRAEISPPRANYDRRRRMSPDSSVPNRRHRNNTSPSNIRQITPEEASVETNALYKTITHEEFSRFYHQLMLEVNRILENNPSYITREESPRRD